MKLPITQSLRESLKLPSTYTIDHKIDAAHRIGGLSHSRWVYQLGSQTQGVNKVYAKWTDDTGIVEITREEFKQIIRETFGV